MTPRYSGAASAFRLTDAGDGALLGGASITQGDGALLGGASITQGRDAQVSIEGTTGTLTTSVAGHQSTARTLSDSISAWDRRLELRRTSLERRSTPWRARFPACRTRRAG